MWNKNAEETLMLDTRQQYPTSIMSCVVLWFGLCDRGCIVAIAVRTNGRNIANLSAQKPNLCPSESKSFSSLQLRTICCVSYSNLLRIHGAPIFPHRHKVSIHTMKRNSVYLCVCFNSSETARDTNIKLGTIDHHPVVSVIRVSS